jgi:hypothetical protein
MEKSDLYTVVGVAAAVAGVIVLAYILARPRPTFVSFTRDSEGRVIEIIEKPL